MENGNFEVKLLTQVNLPLKYTFALTLCLNFDWLINNAMAYALKSTLPFNLLFSLKKPAREQPGGTQLSSLWLIEYWLQYYSRLKKYIVYV